MIDYTILFISIVLTVQSLFSLYLILYTWDVPERLQAGRAPQKFLPAHHSFTVLLPARHEEAVIYETIQRVWNANYPLDLLEVVVICHGDDHGTIAEARRAIHKIGSPSIRVETFYDPPINKPHGLNVGLRSTGNEVVTIFDAEDDISPDIFHVINTVMLNEGVEVVQAGVQLMNFSDHWFSLHNCMEYFFWFKSRLHFHAKAGIIPLGGNTVFIRRELLEQIGGWDEQCLTEDADIGLRLSALKKDIRVIYDAQYATREETPDTVSSFIKQRTRWNQGFLQVLAKKEWLQLPRLDQRLMAFYTLCYPYFQGLTALLWPLSIVQIFFLKEPDAISIISMLPLYSLLLMFVVTAVGSIYFARDYNYRITLRDLVKLALAFFPFQILLGISALRAVYREARNLSNWEKTVHSGAHRETELVTVGASRKSLSLPGQLGLMAEKPLSQLGQ